MHSIKWQYTAFLTDRQSIVESYRKKIIKKIRPKTLLKKVLHTAKQLLTF